MKITILSSNFGGGGISAYAHELINCFSEEYELSVIVGDDSVNKIQKSGVEVYHYNNADLSVNNAKNIISLINDKIKPDIIIGSQSRILPLIVPYLNDMIKIITVSHSLKYVEADIAGFNSSYYDSVIALSEFGKKHLCHRFGKKIARKLVVIPNSVSSVDNINEIINSKKSNKKITIVYTGGTNAPKTPEIVVGTILELLKTDLQFDFYWLGNTQCPLNRVSLLKDVREVLSNDSRVHVLGYVTRGKALDLIAKSNILLLPSRREGSSVSLLEAMSRGTIPIVADFRNANREVVNNHINGFVIDHKNITEFAKQITKIILKPSEYYHLHTNAQKSFSANYSFDVWLKKMGSLLNNLTYDHKTRGKSFNETKYKRIRFLQKTLHHYDYYLMHLQESLPTCINLSKIAIVYKYKK